MDSAELEWIAWTNPITTALGTEVAASDLSGRTVACHQHITPDSICIVGPLLEAGARVRMAPCNSDSTDDRTAARLASMGVEIRGHTGMSAAERADALAWLASEPADALCDMGGELIVAAAAGYRPAGALEATTTGLHRLVGVDIPFRCWSGTGSLSRISFTIVITSVPRRGRRSRRSRVCRCTAARSSWSGLVWPCRSGRCATRPRSGCQRHGGRPRPSPPGPGAAPRLPRGQLR